jgi:hypothetical protein
MSCYKLYKSKTSFYLQKYKKESKNVELWVCLCMKIH